MAKSKPEIISWITFVVVIAIAIVANMLADFLFFRIDLTQDNHYTLSSSSRDVIDRLESPVHFKLFFSQRLPIRFEPVFAYIEDFIEEYRAYGKGKIKVEIIDPGQDEALAGEAYSLGIRETEANVTEKGRMELARIWFGLALIYEDRKEVFPSIGSIENFEYDITSAILNLIRGDQPKVVFVGPTLDPVTGVGHSFSTDMLPLYQELSRLFSVSHAETNGTDELMLDEGVALVCWGMHQYSQEQLYAIDQFIMSGKPAIFLVSGVQVDPSRLSAAEIPRSNADKMFETYGFRVIRNLIADNNCQVIKKNDPSTQVLDHYPLFPVITRAMNGFDPDFEPTHLLKSQLLPWVSELELLNPPADCQTSVIAQTSPQSWLQERSFTLSPQRMPGPTSFASFSVGLALSGPLESAYSKTIPAQVDPATHRPNADHTQLVVLGTDHVLGQYQNQSSLSWMTNTLNYLTGQASLTSIARKENAFRPIKELSYAERQRIQWASVLLAPLGLLVFGVTRLVLRRRRTFARYRTPAGE